MTTPGDTKNKGQRKVLTISSPSRDSNVNVKRSTLTIQQKPQQGSKYQGSTVIVINKKKDDSVKLGSLTAEEKTSRLNALKKSMQEVTPKEKENKNETPRKQEDNFNFEKRQIRNLSFHRKNIKAQEVEESVQQEVVEEAKVSESKQDPEETKVVVEEKKVVIEVRKTEAPKHYRRAPITKNVNFDYDVKKKFRDLNIKDNPTQPTTPPPKENNQAEANKTIQAAASVKQIEANRKKVTHSKGKTQTHDEQPAAQQNKNNNNKNRGHSKLSAAQIARIDGGDTDSLFRTHLKKKKKYTIQNTVQEKILRDVVISDAMTVSDLANKMSEKGSNVVKTLIKMGAMATINQLIDADTAELVATELGHRVQRITEDNVIKNLIGADVQGEEQLERRSPVVTVMGHVDHGKTSLLDALRRTDVAAKEHGGITQHIGAYEVHLPDGQSITFLDTPGHEAFSAMRMRGAKVTDIIILVVAADDGIKAQTVEAINHAKAAKVPIIVAINKMDKTTANFDFVKQSLLQHDIIPDDLGGDVMVIGIAALTGLGLDKLIEAILLQAELLDLKANPKGRGKGYIVEAKLDKIKGSSASLLIQSGELNVGDVIVAGPVFGRIRTMVNDKNQQIKVAGPSMPVEITGLDSVPVAGDEFFVMQNERSAKELVEMLQVKANEQKLLARTGKPKTLQELFTQSNQEVKEVAIIVKADVHGSAEAILHSLNKIEHPEVKVKVLHYGAGAINESDVMLGAASKALVVGFNVRPNVNAKDMALKMGVEMRFYSIIYHLIDDVKSVISNVLSPIERENITGLVEIRKVFDTSKFGKIAGCYVKEGIIRRNCSVRLIRDNQVIHTGTIKSLKRQKDDAKEVKEGFECGLTIDSFDEIRVGDMVEAFEVLSEKKTL